MKNKTLLILLGWLAFTACKKEKSPTLEVTVVNSANNPARGVWVRTQVDGAVFGVVDPRVVDSARSDLFGKVFFEFKNTALVEVEAYSPQTQEVFDSLSVLLETKRLRPNEENQYDRTLRVP